MILAFLKDQDYGIRLSEERTALTDKTIEARNIVAAFEPDGSLITSNKWIMKKHLSYEDYEMYDTKIREFADAFFNYVNSTKHSKEKDTSRDQDEAEEETMEPSGERSVKPKVIVEYHNSENLDEFIQELKGIYLETDLNKKDAEEELAETKANLSRCMNMFNKDPRRAHPNLTECERASLAHVDPDVNLGEEEFYFPHRGECPTIDEHKQAQPRSGYPIKLPLGLNAFFSPNDEKSRELIKTFIRYGYKGIMIKQWSSRPIACFVRGGPSARVELMARHISTKSQNWGTTFGMFRCFFGTEGSCTDPEYEIPTSDCLATTGPSMFTESKKYIGPRLPTRTIVQGHGRDKEIVVVHIEQSDEFRGMIPKPSNKSLHDRHITRADLPFATIGVFHIHPSISHGAAREDLQNEIMP